MSRQTGVRALVINALVAALYIVLAVVPGVFNLASGAIQFRVSEGLNHLVAFNRKYLLGVVVGCVATTPFSRRWVGSTSSSAVAKP